MIGASDAPAPGETETADRCRETFKGENFPERERVVERRPVIVTARKRAGGYSYWSDTQLPNNRGPMFGRDKGAKPLPGSHRKMTGPLMDLATKANAWRLSRQDERQLWAQFLDTGDGDVRQRLVNSCTSKCLAFVQHRLDPHERWAGFHKLLDEVARIVDERNFDPDQASLPAFVDKMLGWRIRDIKRRIKSREKLMVPTDFTGRLEFDDDTGKIAGDVVRAMAESADEADNGDEAEAEIDAETERRLALVAQIKDEVDLLIIQRTVAGNGIMSSGWHVTEHTNERSRILSRLWL